ncbi:DNA primase [candidate division WOR-3 bacterium 4484_100]|uniref:DNA primase n=1 Tax=candidate division WOR-3 bacterium 4484_100 TaxID=1936077 RepID=A0A1V4QG79_UNCW3|nr:MAG: DNA primase [candidate division WOR-3 bacterium 4484_100]
MIEQEKIEEIKRQTDIVELIGHYVPLKKVGKNYRGLCPFHNEENPSFYVNPEKGIFFCFGCKKGGNAISFLMEYEKLDFPEAVKKLAKNLGIEIDTSKGLRYKELYEVNEFAAQFFSSCLNKELGRRGQNYLKERRVDFTRLRDFRLGYAPASGGLRTFMRQKGISTELLIKAGLLTPHNEIFRDRVIFPIFNLSGRIIGFGGRSLEENVQPKYLNSPETPIFKKGDVLYGLFQAKTSIRSREEAILVEGYFDLLSLYQRGVTNICAPLGTSLTDRQAMLLSRFARKVNILFDGDISGIKAALRAIGLLIDAQVEVYIASLPEDTDPDRYIIENGIDQLNGLIKNGDDFFQFYKKHTRVETVEQEVALIKDLLKIISHIRDPIRFDRYLKHISKVFGLPLEVIKKELDRKEEPRSSTQIKISKEEKMMAMILNNREYFHHTKKVLKPEDFQESGVRRIYERLLKNEKFNIYDLTDMIDGNLREKLFSIIMTQESLPESNFVKVLNRYKNGLVEQKLKMEIRQALKNADDEKVKKYQKKLRELKLHSL